MFFAPPLRFFFFFKTRFWCKLCKHMGFIVIIQ
jgi:hypothetical protein